MLVGQVVENGECAFYDDAKRKFGVAAQNGMIGMLLLLNLETC